MFLNSLVSLYITQIDKLLKNVLLRSEHPGLPRWKKVTLSVPLFMASHPIALVWWSRGQEERSLEDDIVNQNNNRSDSKGFFHFDFYQLMTSDVDILSSVIDAFE